MYIAGLGMITPVGKDTLMTMAAVDAGINVYADSPYVNDRLQPVKMALVPQEALPQLSDKLSLGGYTAWQAHLLQLAHAAVADALDGYESTGPIALILACPEHYPQCPHEMPAHFLRDLGKQCGLTFCTNMSRTIQLGRAGGIEAMALAERLLRETNAEEVLVGGVDSYQRPELIKSLLQDQRIAGAGTLGGFTPGEGAAFIRLARAPERALQPEDTRVVLGPAGSGSEPGHLYSTDAYRGEGLATAVRQVSSFYRGPKYQRLFSSMNGERYWAKELGVAMTRQNAFFTESAAIEHPADCYGDLGAASAAVLAGLAAHALLTQRHDGASLVCCSSDFAPRGAIAVVAEHIAPAR